MYPISIIILAAGLSRRMGQADKLFLPFGSTTILEEVIANIIPLLTEELIIVTSPLTHEKIKSLNIQGVRLVLNEDHETGMTSSIQKGVENATQGHYMICLGDQPKIDTATYQKLIESHLNQSDHAITLPFYEGRKGNPVIFGGVYRAAILSHTQPEGCKEIVKVNNQHINAVEVADSGVMMDIDTPEDYQLIRSSQSTR